MFVSKFSSKSPSTSQRDLAKYNGLWAISECIVIFAMLFLCGVELFGVFLAPVFLLIAGLFIGVMAWRMIPFYPLTIQPASRSRWPFLFGILALLSPVEELRKIWHSFPLPTPNSDVIQQLSYQFERFSQHLTPYHPFPDLAWHPFPVYMPLHWLPMGIGQSLHMDVRWGAYLIFVICALVYLYQTRKISITGIQPYLMTCMPAGVLWFHILFLKEDLGVSPEMLIGGYYLIIVTALLVRNHFLLGVGIALALLSRFTLIFWIPLAGILLWQALGFRQTMRIFSIPLTAIICIYILPFLWEDPSFFLQGIEYHNQCAVNDFMDISERIPAGWNATYGMSGLIYFNAVFPEDGPQAVQKTRIIQGGVMLLLMLIGLIGFRSKLRVPVEDYLLVFLTMFIFLFFWFSPMTFRYYYFTVFILLGGLWVRALTKPNNR
ncbi:MAG TPA: hypothetical protein DCF44_11205 [Chitinophagaceae bacterium]|nr:hypothetical protein [Chitinophagaceae bacterium]